jgi:hypothetical protein
MRTRRIKTLSHLTALAAFVLSVGGTFTAATARPSDGHGGGGGKPTTTAPADTTTPPTTAPPDTTPTTNPDVRIRLEVRGTTNPSVIAEAHGGSCTFTVPASAGSPVLLAAAERAGCVEAWSFDPASGNLCIDGTCARDEYSSFSWTPYTYWFVPTAATDGATVTYTPAEHLGLAEPHEDDCGLAGWCDM